LRALPPEYTGKTPLEKVAGERIGVFEDAMADFQPEHDIGASDRPLPPVVSDRIDCPG